MSVTCVLQQKIQQRQFSQYLILQLCIARLESILCLKVQHLHEGFMLNALVVPVIVMVTGCTFLAIITTIVLVVGHVRAA